MATIRLSLALSVILTVASPASSQPSTAPLRLLLSCERSPELTFRFTVENISDAPASAVIGSIEGNDKRFVPAAVTLTIRRPPSADVTVRYAEQFGIIGGRIDPWLIMLPPGASYSVSLPPRFGDERFSEPAQLQVHLVTQPITVLNGDVQGLKLIHVWEGALASNWLQFPADCRP